MKYENDACDFFGQVRTASPGSSMNSRSHSPAELEIEFCDVDLENLEETLFLMLLHELEFEAWTSFEKKKIYMTSGLTRTILECSHNYLDHFVTKSIKYFFIDK